MICDDSQSQDVGRNRRNTNGPRRIENIESHSGLEEKRAGEPSGIFHANANAPSAGPRNIVESVEVLIQAHDTISGAIKKGGACTNQGDVTQQDDLGRRKMNLKLNAFRTSMSALPPTVYLPHTLIHRMATIPSGNADGLHNAPPRFWYPFGGGSGIMETMSQNRVNLLPEGLRSPEVGTTSKHL